MAGNNITFDSVAADALQDSGTSQAVLIQLTGQDVTFSADAEFAGSLGIEIIDSTGTYTFADTDVNPSGAVITALNILGGSSIVNFQTNSSITQSQNARTLLVQGMHTGTLDFDGTINTTNGTGLQFNNADGTYDFSGAITLNGTGNAADTGIDILGGSAGTFTFSGLTQITNDQG